jgi:hypothetical protein
MIYNLVLNQVMKEKHNLVRISKEQVMELYGTIMTDEFNEIQGFMAYLEKEK